MIKNLLFVGKVIYLISPESEVAPPQAEEEGEEKEAEEGEEGEPKANGEAEDGEEVQEKEEEEEEEEDDGDDRPPSLLWCVKKLSLMAKREAAHTPKIHLKVRRETKKA